METRHLEDNDVLPTILVPRGELTYWHSSIVYVSISKDGRWWAGVAGPDIQKPVGTARLNPYSDISYPVKHEQWEEVRQWVVEYIKKTCVMSVFATIRIAEPHSLSRFDDLEID